MHSIPQEPQAPYVQGDMSNAEIRVDLRALTQFITTQDKVITNDVVAQDNQGFDLNAMLVLPLL